MNACWKDSQLDVWLQGASTVQSDQALPSSQLSSEAGHVFGEKAHPSQMEALTPGHDNSGAGGQGISAAEGMEPCRAQKHDPLAAASIPDPLSLEG